MNKYYLLTVLSIAIFLTSASVAKAETFTENLTIGSTGIQVIALQTWLENSGFLVLPTGVSKGYFGQLTRTALAKYQMSQNITPTVGYFGPITRERINTPQASSNNFGTATITVTNETGLLVDDATVTLTKVALGTIDPGGSIEPWPIFGVQRTNSDGKVVFADLSDGIYSTKIEKSNYHKLGTSPGFVISNDKPKNVEQTTRLVKNVSGLDLAVYLGFDKINRLLGIETCNNGDKPASNNNISVPVEIQIGNSKRDDPEHNFGKAVLRCDHSGSNVSFWGFDAEAHGTYQVKAIIDPSNFFDEIDETNNETIISITF